MYRSFHSFECIDTVNYVQSAIKRFYFQQTSENTLCIFFGCPYNTHILLLRRPRRGLRDRVQEPATRDGLVAGGT